LDEAVKYLKRIVAHADYELGVRLLLGQVYANMGKAKEAVIELLEALKLADAQMVPTRQAEALKQMYEPLIEAQMQQPSNDLQVRLYNNIRELLVRPDWREHLARARDQLPVESGANALPTPVAEILTEARSSQVVEAIAKINQLARKGHYRTAMEEAFYALQAAPTYLPLHLSMADLLLRQERRPEAVVKYKTVAQSYFIRGEAARAISTFRRIIDLSPMDMEARSRLIELMIAHGQSEAAVAEYLRLVDVYYSLADLPNARQTCNQALRLTQQTTVNKVWRLKVLRRMADIDLQSLDWRSALRSFDQIRSLQPDDEQAHTSLVELNFRLGNEPQALKELDAYLTTLQQAGQRDKAIQFLENLIAENQKQPGARRRLGELYRQMGRVEEAIEQLDAAGEMYLDIGNKAAATETIMSILSLNPPNTGDYQKLLAQIK
jgi:tetratricopeptide (TPR) repeat protein